MQITFEIIMIESVFECKRSNISINRIIEDWNVTRNVVNVFFNLRILKNLFHNFVNEDILRLKIIVFIIQFL